MNRITYQRSWEGFSSSRGRELGWSWWAWGPLPGSTDPSWDHSCRSKVLSPSVSSSITRGSARVPERENGSPFSGKEVESLLDTLMEKGALRGLRCGKRKLMSGIYIQSARGKKLRRGNGDESQKVLVPSLPRVAIGYGHFDVCIPAYKINFQGGKVDLLGHGTKFSSFFSNWFLS